MKTFQPPALLSRRKMYMPEYQLELKQLVDYPRCRIYRKFIQSLIADRNFHSHGGSGLFYYIVLCSLVNFRFSYRRIERTSYLVSPGEWICTLNDLTAQLRLKRPRQALQMLERLQKQHYITFSLLARGRVVKFKITAWQKSNTVLDYNAPCQKDAGFFFFPIAILNELIGMGKCSELDILLDLWLHTVYRDERVRGSIRGRWSTTAAAPASHLSAIPNWRNAGVFPVPRSAVPSTSWLKTAI